jgi:hypothetical protein
MWIGKNICKTLRKCLSPIMDEGASPVNGEDAGDLAKARDFATCYRCEFINLNTFHLQQDVFKKVPVDLMYRYNFVPLEVMPDGRIAIAVADPSQLMSFDEISLLLGKRLSIHVATLTEISEFLNKFDRTKGIDEDPEQIVASSPDEPGGPSCPEAPVFASFKPKPPSSFRHRSSRSRERPRLSCCSNAFSPTIRSPVSW